MKSLLSTLLVSINWLLVPLSQNKVPSPELQIKLALLAAPANKRDSATV
jgi:hypothetical protein